MKFKIVVSSLTVASCLYAAGTAQTGNNSAVEYMLKNTTENIEAVREALKEFESIKDVKDLESLMDSNKLQDNTTKAMSVDALKNSSSMIKMDEIKDIANGSGFDDDPALKGLKLDMSADDIKNIAAGKGFIDDTDLADVKLDLNAEDLSTLSNSFKGNIEEIASGKIDELTPEEIATMQKENANISEKDRKKYEEKLANTKESDVELVRGDLTKNASKYGNFKAPQQKQLSDKQTSACGAILCLASGTGSGVAECAEYLAEYFAIEPDSWREPWTLITNRLNFLKLCPKDDGMDAEGAANMNSLLNIYANMNGSCDKNTLNSYLEYFSIAGDGAKNVVVGSVITDKMRKLNIDKSFDEFVRINPNKPKYCQDLSKHSYGIDHADVKYTCNANEYYLKKDWNRGYYFKEVSKAEYDSLSDDLKGSPRNAWIDTGICVRSKENECRKWYYYPYYFNGDWIKTGLREYKAMEYPVCVKKDSSGGFGHDCKQWEIRTTKYYKKVFINKECWSYVRTK